MQILLRRGVRRTLPGCAGSEVLPRVQHVTPDTGADPVHSGRFDGKRLVGTGTTLPVFNYLNPLSEAGKDLVDQTGVEL